MKKLSKLIALVLSLCVALSLVAGCGGSEGEIKGNYKEVEKVSTKDLAKANTALMAATCENSSLIKIADTNAKVGVSLKSSADFKVSTQITEGDKTEKYDFAINGSTEAALAVTSDAEGELATLAAMLKVNGKVSLPNAIFSKEETGNREISAKEELYVDASEGLKGAYIYFNTDIKGLPEKEGDEPSSLAMILGKKKVTLANLFALIKSGDLPIEIPSMPEIDLSETVPAEGFTVVELQSALMMIDATLSFDCSDGIKIKISSSATTKDKIKALMVSMLKVTDLSELKIDKLNFNFYLHLDEQGHLIATAANADVKIEIPASLTKGVKLNMEGNASFSLNIGNVEVKIPDDIKTDKSYEELFAPQTDAPQIDGDGDSGATNN